MCADSKGPPGTGKTYLGVQLVKVLLHNKKSLGLGPIICVYVVYIYHPDIGSCKTNHALDQFLYLLLEEVTKELIRMGAGSKLAALDEHNIQNVLRKKRKLIRKKEEKSEEGNLHILLNQLQEEGTYLCETLADGHSKMNWKQISSFVKSNFPIYYEQLVCEVDEEGFQTAGLEDGSFFGHWKRCIDIQVHKSLERFYGNLRGSESLGARADRTLRQLLSSTDIWDLSESERKQVIRHWESQLREKWLGEVDILNQRRTKAVHDLGELNSKYRERLLRQADIIGLTTAGLAKNASLLEMVNPKTLICEEAGEVLEVSISRVQAS